MSKGMLTAYLQGCLQSTRFLIRLVTWLTYQSLLATQHTQDNKMLKQCSCRQRALSGHAALQMHSHATRSRPNSSSHALLDEVGLRGGAGQGGSEQCRMQGITIWLRDLHAACKFMSRVMMSY